MDENIVIRELNESIFEGYRRLRLRALKEEPTAYTSSWGEEIIKSNEYWRQRIHSPLVRMFCAVEGNHVLGMTGCQFFEKEKRRHKATLIAVYLEPEYRGSGLGRTLSKTTIQVAFEDPQISSIKLTVTAGNKAAIGLYERLGFERWGEEPEALKIDDVFYSKVCMELTRERWEL